ncbi:transposase [Candidatus Peregrinibacteria bacterium]|nr:transposase [Candidatus Peregrinibacteria bacterium]
MFQRHPVQNTAMMFITTNVHHRWKIFQNPTHAREAIETLYRVQLLHPFFLHGFVIMPDHCHFLLRVPPPESISLIMNVYKAGLTFQLGIGPIWQSRFHLIIPKNSATVLRYIHQNPVVEGLAPSAEDYPWSSASGKWDVTELRYS